MFKKYDQGKPRFDYLTPFTKEFGEVNKVLDYGAVVKKYGKDNWRLGSNEDSISRNKNAALRHLFASLGGEPIDSESGLPHLAHALCDILFAFWHENQQVSTPKLITTEDIDHLFGV